MKRNFWPLGIVTAFVIFISGTVGLIVMASAQREDLVNRNYYEQELRYQSRLDSLNRAARSGATAHFDGAEQRLVIAVPKTDLNPDFSGAVQLYRPSEAGMDREEALTPDANGRALIDMSKLQTGLWKVRISWKAGGQEYQLETSLTNWIATRARRPLK